MVSNKCENCEYKGNHKCNHPDVTNHTTETYGLRMKLCPLAKKSATPKKDE